MNTFEDLIRSYVSFNHGKNAQGWQVTYCEYCGDGKRTKGPRGGWNFIDGGNTAFYHCFNCGCNENFSLNRDIKFSKKMTEVLDSFGIPKNEYLQFLVTKTKNEYKKSAINPFTYIDMPESVKLLDDSIIAKECKKFIRSNYKLTIDSYSFLYGTGVCESKNRSDINIAKSLKNRIIIPFYHKGNLIYYQARDITNKSKLKYLSPPLPKNNIIFNVDLLDVYDKSPLYVTEGIFDAIHLNGIAVLGNELSAQQVKMLKQSKRRKILVPDFNGDSNKLVEHFVDNGWDVSIPQYSKTCKDVSESVKKYGKLFTCYDIATNIKSARSTKILMNMI